MKSNHLKVIPAVLVMVLLSQCAVQFYPRKVTPKEKFTSNVAFAIDSLGALLSRDVAARESKRPENQALLVKNYMFYADPKFHDPKNFIAAPAAIKDMKMELLDDTKDYQAFYCSWPSFYKPVNPEFQKLYDTYQEDWTVYAIYIKSKKPNRAAMVVTHGWTVGDVRKSYKSASTRALRPVGLGFDVLFIQQPYHGLRAPKGSFFSGSMFLSAEVSRLNEAVCQSVTDMRSGVHWLKSQGYQVVGMYGGSLGGIVTLDTAVTEPMLDFIIAWVPPSSLAEIITQSQLVPYVAQNNWDSGIGLGTARQIFYPTSPANFQPAISKDDVLIVAGMGDNFVPVNQPITVWENWGKPEIYWFAGGHVATFGIKQVLKAEDEFLARQLKKLN